MNVDPNKITGGTFFQNERSARKLIEVAIGLLVTIIASLFLIGCSDKTGSKEVDGFLNELQSQVQAWETKSKSGQISLADVQQLAKDSGVNAKRLLELGRQYKFSDAQTKRSTDLSSRLQKVAEQIRQNVTSGRTR